MNRIERVVVAIPARDEAQRLPAALAAVHAAIGMCAVPVVIVVAADVCTDDTAEVARAGGALVVISSAGRVGAARAAAIRTALEGETDPAHVWIANTDADSVVPEDWLAVHLEFAERGVDLLRGAVRPDPHGLADGQLHRWRARHPSVEDHEHVHGANIGITAAAYLAVGGFPDVALHEDVELVHAVQAAGLHTASTARASVTTSSRPLGRLDGGFAAYLREHILRPAAP